MADSAKRKSDGLENRNAIALVSRPEALRLQETNHLFATIRQTYLSQPFKKARVPQEQGSAWASGNWSESVSEPADIERKAPKPEGVIESGGAAGGTSM